MAERYCVPTSWPWRFKVVGSWMTKNTSSRFSKLSTAGSNVMRTASRHQKQPPASVAVWSSLEVCASVMVDPPVLVLDDIMNILPYDRSRGSQKPSHRQISMLALSAHRCGAIACYISQPVTYRV